MRRILLASTVLGWSFAAHAQTAGSGTIDGLNYVTLTPAGGCTTANPCQVLEYLHPLGEENKAAEQVQRYFNTPTFWAANPRTMVVAPMINGSSAANNWGDVSAGINGNMTGAVDLVKQVKASVPTAGGVTLTGGSMGAIGGEQLMALYGPKGSQQAGVYGAGLFYDGAPYQISAGAAKATLCGVPLTIVHGSADDTVDPGPDQNMAQTLSGCPGFTFVSVPGASHGTYSNAAWGGYEAGTLINQTLDAARGGTSTTPSPTASVTPSAVPVASAAAVSTVAHAQATATAAAFSDQITPDSGALADAAGNAWMVTSGGHVMKGDTLVEGGGDTSALMMDSTGQIWGKDNGQPDHYSPNPGEWFTLSGSTWTPSATPPPGASASANSTPASLTVIPSYGPVPQCGADPSAGSGGFHIANGQIIGPNGKPFIARGINLYEEQTGEADAVQATFKGINFIRINIHSYKDPSTYTAFVQKMTAQGIVIAFEDHPDAGGGQDPAFTGSKLATELAWYASMAKAYAANPYVWFGTFNEPGTQGGSVSLWEKQTYDAIRGAGNNNPILLQIVGWPGAWNNSMNPADFASMTNTVWDTHYYGWVPRYSTDQATVDKALSDLIAQVQQMQSADGVMPAIIGEYGDATDGTNIDTNGTQTVTAVINAGSSGKAGSAAWHWNPGGNADHLMAGSQPTSPFGQMVQLFINTDIVPPSACQANANAVQTLATLSDTVTKSEASDPGTTLTETEVDKQTAALQAQLDAINAKIDALKVAP